MAEEINLAEKLGIPCVKAEQETILGLTTMGEHKKLMDKIKEALASHENS